MFPAAEGGLDDARAWLGRFLAGGRRGAKEEDDRLEWQERYEQSGDDAGSSYHTVIPSFRQYCE